MSSRSKHWFVLGGIAAGALIWAYDYDFFLNAGGPATPISTAILHAAHLEQANAFVWVILPAAILIAAGAIFGFALSSALALRRGREDAP